MRLDAVLLDLDGTLVDTAPDLVAVLNRMLLEEGRPPMPYAIARNEASNGANGLLKLGFGSSQPAPELERRRERFLALYADSVCVGSRLFIDMQTIELDWGIVTNKPERFTTALLGSLGIAAGPGCVVSGDRLPQRKPHPAPLLLAAAELHVPAARCVYVGDAPRDIEAGRAAGMATIAAAYGYIRPSADPQSWGADAVIRRPGELRAALRALGAQS